MSSWLSGGLSQFSSLTDQISSFTKDVLTETTEEIEDPTAELQVARRKIEHLEDVNSHYKTEWEKLQKHSEEVRERAETAECQIAAISQEYRKLIHEKDNELRRLRAEAVNLKEQQRKFVASDESQSPLKELAGKRFFPKSEEIGEGGRRGEGGDQGMWEAAVLEPVGVVEGGGWEGGGGGGRGEIGVEEEWGEYHDFGDVISSQGEINRLQLELSRVKVENQHWKRLAEEKGHTGGGGGPIEAELASLREQVEDLQLCLQRERGQHRQEMSALEATHHEKLRRLDQNSQVMAGREEMVQVQLQEAMEDGAGLKRDTIRGSLLPTLEEVSLDERGLDERDGDRDKRDGSREEVSSFRSELEASREKCVRLEGELERLHAELKWQCKERKETEAKERETMESLKLELQSLKAQKATLEHEKASVGHTVEGLRQQVKCLEERNSILLVQEQVVGQLQMELKDSRASNEALQAEMQLVVAEKSHLSHKTAQLSSSLDTQKEAMQQLHSEVECVKRQFTLEREAYTRHAEQEKEKLTVFISELQADVSEHEQCIAKLRAQCEHSQRDADTVTTQISSLVAEVQSKDHQLEILQGQELKEKADGEGKTTLVSRADANLEPEAVLVTDGHQGEYADGGLEHSQLNELKGKLEAESNQSERLQAHLMRLTEEHDRELAQLVSEREGLEQEVSRLESELEESRRVSASVSAVEDTAQQQGMSTDDSPSPVVVTETGVSDAGVGEQLQETFGVLEDLRRSNSEKDAIISQLNLSLSSANFVKSELEASVEKSKSEMTILRGRLGEMEGRERERETAEALAQVEHVKEELRVKEGQKMELLQLLQDRESRIAQLETEAGESRVRLSQVAAALTTAENTIKEKELVIEHSERNLQEVGKLLSMREEEVAMLQREKISGQLEENEMLSRAEESSAALEVVTRDRDELLVSMRMKESEMEDIQAQLLETCGTLDTLNHNCQQMASQNAELAQLNERAQSDISGVRSERDGLAGRVRVLEETTREVGEELGAKQAECSKLTKQLEHLKAHLVQVEDQYMQDALRAGEREQEERRRAEKLQETLCNTSYTGQQENLQTKAQVLALEEQLHALAGQRDAAVLQLSVAREEAENNAAALRNLQSVLEQFQRDQSSELSVALKRSQTELASALSELKNLRPLNVTVQEQLREAKGEIDVLRHQIVEREKRLEELQQQVTGLQATLHSTEGAMERLMREEGGRVDQSLVKNLVVGYVQAPDRKKPEVLNLIAKILDFTPSEVEQVQGRKGNWLSGLWGRATTPSPASPKTSVKGGSLAQLFVSFLETESTPTASSLALSSHSHLSPPPIGRVDPVTDPDRPSRATAASLALPPPLHSSVHPPSSHSLSDKQCTSAGPTTSTERIHSRTDTPLLDTGTTKGSHASTSTAVLDSIPLGSLTLPNSGPFFSSVPPTSKETTKTQLIASSPISSTSTPDTATRPLKKNRGPAPVQSRNHSNQSSILKNLLSTD